MEQAGINCTFEERSGEGGGVKTRRYDYRRLPKKLRAWYGYASAIVSHLRSNTAKIVVHSSSFKCELMENAPAPNFSLQFFG